MYKGLVGEHRLAIIILHHVAQSMFWKRQQHRQAPGVPEPYLWRALILPAIQLCAPWQSCVMASVTRQLGENEGQDIERKTDKVIPGFHMERPWKC